MIFRSLVKKNTDTRSSNILYDQNEAIINSYIVTDRTHDLLMEILNCTNSGIRTRSYSLIGPYGTGKSSFISFLISLTSKDFELASKAIKRLPRKTMINSTVALKDTNFPKGFVLLPILSSNDSLRVSLVSALLETPEVKKNKRILKSLQKPPKMKITLQQKLSKFLRNAHQKKSMKSGLKTAVGKCLLLVLPHQKRSAKNTPITLSLRVSQVL
jgi:ABC-type branched-subunit amino acid transport system ATPase component